VLSIHLRANQVISGTAVNILGLGITSYGTNAIFGSGGSGDVLAGVIGGLLAQGLSAVDAGRVGAYVHGRAGDALSEVYGARGVMSSDLPLAVAVAIRELSPE